MEESEHPKDAEVHAAHVEEDSGARVVVFHVLPQRMHAWQIQRL